MKKCKLIHCAVMVSLACGLNLATAADLASLKSEYEQSKQKLASVFDTAIQNSLLTYSNALTAIEAQFKKEGNLEGLLAVRKEKELFAATGEIPKTVAADLPQSIIQAQLGHLRRTQQAETARDKNLALLGKQYLAQLDALKKQLTSEDKIDDALEVQTEMKNVQTVLALVGSSSSPGSTSDQKTSEQTLIPFRKNLILYFTFANDKKSEVFDKSGKRNEGKAYERQPHEDATRGAVFKCDNLSYVEVRDSPSLTPKAITVAAWVKPSAHKGVIVDKMDRRCAFT